MQPRQMQNGYYRKDAFNPLEELRRARAANAGQRLMAERAKQVALGAGAKICNDVANVNDDMHNSIPFIAPNQSCNWDCYTILRI